MAAVYKPRREDGSKLVSMLSFASRAGDTHDIPSLETLWRECAYTSIYNVHVRVLFSLMG